MTQNSLDARAVQRAVAVAGDYDALMGLTWVAMGAGFLMAAATGQPGVWIALGSAFGTLCPQWYYRRFGFVRPRPERVAWAWVGVALFFPVLVTAWILDRWLSPPVVLCLLVVAAGLATCQVLTLRRVGLTAAHWAVYAALVAAAFAPMARAANHGLFTPFVLAAVGAALVAIGLVDHVRLVTAMAPAAVERQER